MHISEVLNTRLHSSMCKCIQYLYILSKTDYSLCYHSDVGLKDDDDAPGPSSLQLKTHNSDNEVTCNMLPDLQNPHIVNSIATAAIFLL